MISTVDESERLRNDQRAWIILLINSFLAFYLLFKPNPFLPPSISFASLTIGLCYYIFLKSYVAREYVLYFKSSLFYFFRAYLRNPLFLASSDLLLFGKLIIHRGKCENSRAPAEIITKVQGFPEFRFKAFGANDENRVYANRKKPAKGNEA
jgi:hypothetical protein